ncbi:MAG: LexA repressor [Candidatus Beckwithbacteria bacterium GW2011_GWB1_47_15]|uniref:LexA repressor n=1 Tax=Candidatus Beckwithbacteria bacterium GW2011_GWB1_47_15 TaxID=1618371 RepID=A0A0G1RUG3_9BACT|nr:MAG: SOS-response transcriptional repressor, LexA, repressor LexA [Candidatus Beckwithbacteria bacterium GW2011_GWC1_49_16]KKU35138.1 MAG: LexA repressor [Candidatus Beckwithbacteria bacterium GW2011_GWA1_46_30]KKU60782.1 MAG: LexA repressor [Candidatus Beckwithbacteria bacterium GW2011_GWB1_47_15]KKU71587.1 MAG: LexA repressor [Candidatus Beckwithbacteria bacterium GW2011_GWA2_47_25]KKW03460.1 MAG: LexA repressor [Candidatus Beckwithbacteria bacterium GW2011_GWC2_49_11]OGD49166.1 MAG: repr
MPVTLYRRQKQIVDFISQYIQRNGNSPTLQEIADAMGLSSLATVHEHIATLVRKGVLKKYEGSVRGLEIADDRYVSGSDGLELPILGYIAAGKPIEPYTDPDAAFTISPTLVSGKKRSFVLQVKGDSMVEEGILDGDYVVIEEQDEVTNGDIVVALLENGLATLKRFFKEATRVRLEPANSQMSPIYATNVKIQGRVVGVIRRFV